jgi:AraC-like DNA-binding protein
MPFELQTLEEYSDETLLAELRRVAEAMKGQRLTIERFNSLARVHSTTLRYRFGSWQAALDKAGISESVAPRFRVLDRDAVLEALREFVVENPGKSVTEQAIAARLGMYRGSITRRFGKWEAILANVGLDPVPLGRRYTDEECFENILALWSHYGRQPIFGELKQLRLLLDPKHIFVGGEGGVLLSLLL